MAEAGQISEAAKPKSVGVQTYARVRCFFKDRESLENAVKTKSAKQTGKKGQLTVLSRADDSIKTLITSFTDVLSSNTGNEDCFEIVCIPLINKVLEGFKALLIAYGQSGSGKTYSLIGAKGPGQLGLLPRTIKSLLANDLVQSIRMKGFESYSTSLMKIVIFDLFEEKNKFVFDPFVKPTENNKVANKIAENKWVQRKSQAAKALWRQKGGRSGYNTMTQGLERAVDSVEAGFELVDEAHDASHFAKTGKNPESSRGHTMYILKLEIKSPKGRDFDNIKTEFVVIDLAGSEGSSTLDALPDGPDKTARFLEGGVINYGLTQLKDMFTEMRRKGKLKTSEGNGLRKMLYPYVTRNTMMSIVFTLSPSIDNIMPTRATMKFAQDACKLKMKPVADKGKQNWKKMYDKLKATLQDKIKVIEELEAVIEEGTTAAGPIHGMDTEIIKANITQAFEEKWERLYGIFKDYELDQYVDPEVMEQAESEMAAKKEDYTNRLLPILEKHAPERVKELEEAIESEVREGNNLHTYYEDQCKKYQEQVEGDGPKHIRFSSTLHSIGDMGLWSPRGREPSTADVWRAKAMKVKIKSQKVRLRGEKTMKSLDALFDGDDLEMTHELLMELHHSDDDESDYEDEETIESLHHNMHKEQGFQLIDPTEEEHILYEDHDFSVAPDFLVSRGQFAQGEIETLVKNNLNMGSLNPKAKDELQDIYGFKTEEIEDIVTYVMTAVGHEQDHQTVSDFKEELNSKSQLELDTSSESVGTILELKNEIHRLENMHRVERTMKLWGTMRVKIRDRKLANLQETAQRIEDEKQELHRNIDELRTRLQSGVDTENNQRLLFESELQELKYDLERERTEKSKLSTALAAYDRDYDDRSGSLSEVGTILDGLKSDLDTFHEKCKTFLMRSSSFLEEDSSVPRKLAFDDTFRPYKLNNPGAGVTTRSDVSLAGSSPDPKNTTTC